MHNIIERIQELAPELQEEVADFVSFLIAKQNERKSGTPSFTWAGSVKEMCSEYTSVELQHAISKWRIAD